MRRGLDLLYEVSGWAAALSLFLIFLLVGVQVLLRLLDIALSALGLPILGLIVPSIAEICGFLLAAASFLALAKTLSSFAHIRVGMLVDRMPPLPRRWTETAVGFAACALSAYATVAVARLAWKSFAFHDVSYGLIAVPLALPQGVMTLGLAILTVALADFAHGVWRGRIVLRSGGEG